MATTDDPNDPRYIPGTPEYEAIQKKYAEDNARDNSNAEGTAPESEEDRTRKAMEAAAAKAEADRILAYNNHFQFGGYEGGATEAAKRYEGTGQWAQGRIGERIDYGQANWDREMAGFARNQQVGVADMMRERAAGRTPSIAQMQADRQMRQASAEQSSAAASARGPAALALAQQGAAANTAATQSGISNMAQINAANERMEAEKSAYAAYSGIRGGDFQAGGMAAQRAQAQAQINAAQYEANDRLQLGMTGAAVDVQKAQLAAQGNQAAIQAGISTADANRAQAGEQFDDSRWDKYAVPAIGAGAAIGGAILVNSVFGGGKSQALPGTGGVSAPGEPAGYGTPGGSNPSNSPGDGYYDEHGNWISSDVRLKRGIKKDDSRVDQFLDGIRPLSYHYKDAENEPRSVATGGRYLGISAQDLEAVPEVGHQMVSDGPRGKRIESGPTLSAALAGLARLHERVKELEGGEGITSDIRAKEDIVSEGARAPREAVTPVEPGHVTIRGTKLASRKATEDEKFADLMARRRQYGSIAQPISERMRDDYVAPPTEDPRREGFLAGVNHTQAMHDTGVVSEAPDYMRDTPVTTRSPVSFVRETPPERPALRTLASLYSGVR